MKSNKEIFRFVQMRNVPQKKAGKPHKPGDDSSTRPRDDVKPQKHQLDWSLPGGQRLRDQFEKSPKGVTGPARAYLHDLMRNKKELRFFSEAARRIKEASAIPLEQLVAMNRRGLQKLRMNAAKLENLRERSAHGYVALHVLSMAEGETLTYAENAMRGIALSQHLLGDQPSRQTIANLASAGIVVNGFSRGQLAGSDADLVDLEVAHKSKRLHVQMNEIFGGPQVQPTKLVPYNGRLLKVSDRSSSSAMVISSSSVPTSVGEPRTVSIGELILTKEVKITYDFAEIAHIENVMQTESRSRLHQIKTTNETVDFEETEITETSVQELKTTEQYDLAEAISSSKGKTTSLSANAGFTASYGPVSASASGSVSSTSTSQSSMSRASNYSREIVDNAVSELSSRVKTSRQTTSKIVVVERNRHGFDNTLGQGHVVGVYRYINRIVDLETINYGNRLMLEFVVPEPAANLVHAISNAAPEGMVLIEPEPFEMIADDIDPENYGEVLGLYGVANIKPPPPERIKIPASINVEALDKTEYKDDEFAQKEKNPDHEEPKKGYISGVVSVSIPDGYHLERMQSTVAWVERPKADDSWWKEEWIRIACDRAIKTFNNKPNSQGEREERAELTPTTLQGDMEVAWASHYRHGCAVSLSVECVRTDATTRQWQAEVWSDINNAYLSEKRAYDSQLAYAQSTQTSFEDSPTANRLKEQRELKRAAITLMTDQDFSMFGSIEWPPATAGDTPVINTHEAAAEANYIRFFEESIEWANMAHVLYDYAWAGSDRWIELLGLGSNDLEHEAFLQSGAAKVAVPVMPGYEIAVLNYLQSGVIWDGEGEPELDKDHQLYDQIMTLIAEPRDLGEIQIDTMTVTLPTNLVMLQADNDLNNPTEPGPIETPDPILIDVADEDEVAIEDEGVDIGEL